MDSGQWIGNSFFYNLSPKNRPKGDFFVEDIKPSLTGFIDGGDLFEKILVVESYEYISELAERFPMSEIFFITPEEEIAEKFFDKAKVIVMDYREKILPFDEEFFDLIIGDLTLEVVINPQDIAVGFSRYLKQTGVWLTSFRNIRHWKILEKLMRGRFGGIVSRFYTRTEFERILYASFYKHVRLSPLRKKAPPELLKKLVDCGFENIGGDLEVEFWLIRAARSMPELALLKSMFTEKIRAEFSRIIHRIEYNIDVEENVKNFWQLFDAEGIFTDYAAAFIRSVVVHRENFYENLKNFSSRPEIEEIIEICESLYDVENDGGLLK